MFAVTYSWLAILGLMLLCMKMSTDLEQMDHYYLQWRREENEDIASVDWGDAGAVEAYKSRSEARSASYKAHRKAIWGF